MRNLLIGILLAGTAVAPALAQDNNTDGRWHHDQQQGGRGEGHQRQQPPAQQQQQPQQDGRGQRWNGPNMARQQQAPQMVREQQQVQVEQGRDGQHQGWERRRFEGRPGVQPQGYTQQGYPQQQQAYPQQQQGYGYRGQVQVERNRDGGWTRHDGYRDGDAQQQMRGGWYGQRGIPQQQYRNGDRYAGRSWNRDWRSDHRYDWRRYRDSHRSVFELGVYVDPFGYGYRSFGIGYRLPPVYFGQSYWINPAMFDLPYPPPGTQWVRYWNDALLVDIYTGQVVDVIQGFFW